MTSILGPAPIVDFDGTLLHLSVEWARLRRELVIDRIDDLWQGEDSLWEAVAAAEVVAAATSPMIEPVIAALAEARAVAVLTSNAEEAVEAFLARVPALQRRVTTIVGRTALGGPKTEFDRFRTGFDACVQATASARSDGVVVYCGDRQYELEFARSLGATAIDAADVVAVVGEEDR